MNVSRPATVWVFFGICMTVLLLAMAWVTAHTLRLEDQRIAAVAERDLQENVRLALWRMESTAGSIVFAENARPAQQFKDFHAAGQLYTSAFQTVQKGQVIVPSPLLNEIPEHARLYGQINSMGEVTSPQVPLGNNRDLAEQNYLSNAEIDSASSLLTEARDMLAEDVPVVAAPIEIAAVTPSPTWSLEQSKSSAEFASRARAVRSSTSRAAETNIGNPKIKAKTPAVAKAVSDAGFNAVLPDSQEPFNAVWRGDELFLIRDATLDGESVKQFVWLDSGEVDTMLKSEVTDIFPKAALQPTSAVPPESESTLAHTNDLVSLPFRLEPGDIKGTTVAFWSPVRRSLAIAWGCILAVALVAGALVYGIVGLSERRAAFVSAVTHELRTPLTTFRLYSEMLSGDMVKEPDKQKGYLKTMTSEADRLSHLVENVLAYARIEKGSARAHIEELSLQSIIDRVLPRLNQRAAHDDLKIEVEAGPDAEKTMVKVDVTAVEQILFNLVDNACKYGRDPEDENGNVIHLEADTDGPMALLRVRDHGRGISRSEEGRLFRPFEKSADEAARTAPGVGLGLALCRKLSRALGGDLKLCSETQGTCFVLALPSLAS